MRVRAINMALLTECERSGDEPANVQQSVEVVRATPLGVGCL